MEAASEHSIQCYVSDPKGGDIYFIDGEAEVQMVNNRLQCDNYLWMNCGSSYDPKTDCHSYFFNAITSAEGYPPTTYKFQKVMYILPTERKCLIHYMGNEELGCKRNQKQCK